MGVVLLFVYGTLRRGLGHPMHGVLAETAEYAGEATCAGRLYDLGYYPGAVFDTACGLSIRGEVYRLMDGGRVLASLDRYEGCAADESSPTGFARLRVEARLADGSTRVCWAYAYGRDTSRAELIADGDYAAHCRLRVRAETHADYDAIDRVNQAAFGRDVEARLVRALRGDPAFDPRLSLVGECAGEVVGHILFTRIKVIADGAAAAALALAPLAVSPEHQRRGIGSRLVRVGLRLCREFGHTVVVVIGHAEYYPRFGFLPARAHGLDVPFPVPDEAFMVCALERNALAGVRGMVRYAPPFDEFA